MDAFNGSSFDTYLEKSAEFKTPPHLPHGIRGIFISHNAVIRSNSIIFHQVFIGDNVKIGTNCVVCEGIPSNSTVALNKPRIIIKDL